MRVGDFGTNFSFDPSVKYMENLCKKMFRTHLKLDKNCMLKFIVKRKS